MCGWEEHICPICKKNFIPAPYHIYKTASGGYLVCTYSCMLESRRQHEQRKNKTANNKGRVVLTYNGETHNIEEWSDITGISAKTIRTRYHLGWSAEKILTKEVRHRSPNKEHEE